MNASPSEKARTYLRVLSEEIPTRQAGSQGNQAATTFFANTVAPFGFEVGFQQFSCLDWTAGDVRLLVDGIPFEALASPFSLGCEVRASLKIVSTIEQLEAAELAGNVVLLRGEIAREQLMPKNFPFYRPDSHQHIIRLLETKRPSAIITAAPRDGEVVGASYPWPMIADGDFDIPSVYVSNEEGRRLAEMAGRPASLASSCTRIPSIGRNVIARRGPDAGKQVVLLAHIDTKMGTPGAVDNASGVVTLLLLAERLADYAGNIRIELVAMNGEEHYASPGEQQYLTEKRCDLTEIALAVNLDGLGYRDGNTAYSMYGCPPDVVSVVRDTFGSYLGLMEGEPWYQGDHTMFLQNQRPALAITSERAMQLLAQVIHSPKDCPEIVDVSRPVEMANALRDLVQALDQHLEENLA